MAMAGLRQDCLKVSVHETIDDIDPQDWDAVVGPGRLYQGHAFLRACEGGALIDIVPRYVVVRDEQGFIVATVAAYIIPTSLVLFARGFIKAAVERVRTVLPSFLRLRILECGSPLGPGNGINIRRGVRVAPVAVAISDALDRIAARAGLRLIVLRDLQEAEREAYAAFRSAGFVTAEGLPTMSLDIRWNSFAEYLASLRSPHRKKVRRGLSLAESSGLRVRSADRVAGNAGKLARQRENVRELASEYNRERLTATFFAQLDREFGSRVRVLEVVRGTASIASALLIDDGSILRGVSFGREFAGARDGAYFLVIASSVEMAIKEGKAVLDLGMTTHGPKTDFGARMIPQWMLLRFRGPLGKLLPLALACVNPARRSASRRAFKKSA